MSISTLQQYEVLSESGLSDLYSSDITIRNELPSNQPEYKNLLDSEAPQMSEPDSLITSPSEINSKPMHIPVTPDLPPRPVLLPKKYAVDSMQNNHEATKRSNTTPLKSCTRSRCISPSPSIVSTSSLSSQKSNSLQRCKYTPKSITQTLRRPHVLHRKCSLNMAQLEQLSNTGSPTDIVVVYSKVCQVSADWARYFKALYEIRSESASYGTLSNKTPSSKSGVSIKVILQEVEEFSSKVYQLNSSTNNESSIRQELINLEERNYHAKCHIVIVGYHFLDWVYRNPSLIVGTLFGEINSGLGESGFDTTGSTIGLLLGVTAKDVKAEHRAALLTFQQWNLMNIEEDCSQLIDDDGQKVPTFSERLFKATIMILKKDDEKRKEQHYRIPSSVHMPAASPTFTLPQNLPAFSSKQDVDWVEHNRDPTFKILSNNLDVPSINALQRNLVLLMSQCISPKDNIECYFVCVEGISKTDESSVNLNTKETFNVTNKNIDTSTSSQEDQADKFELGNSYELAKQKQHAQEKIEIPLTNISEEKFPLLPPKQNKSRRNSVNKFIKGSESKRSLIKLDFSCPSGNIIEVDISKKVFSRLNTFLLYSKSDQDSCDRYIELEIKVNGKFCKPTKCIETGTYSQPIKIENPLSTFEHLMETSTLITDSSLNCVNGMNKAISYGLNQNLASLVSRNVPVDLFSWMLKYESSGSSKEVSRKEVMFPTLIHWAAYHGMDKLVVSLLNLPGSSIAAQQLNCNLRSSSEMAKDQGYHNIFELIESRSSLTSDRLSSDGDKHLPSKLTNEKMHVYEYPSVTFATYRGPIDTNESNLNSPLPPQSNISPPPTPPSVSKLYDLKIEYEKYNRKSLRTSSSLSGESWTPSTNRSSTVSSGLVDIVNNDLYDIPRSSNINSIAKCSEPSADCIDLEAPLSSELLNSESDKLNDSVNHVDLTNEINKPQCITKTDTIDKKPTEYSYIPMQPRCNSTGQSSYSSSSTDNQYCRSESSSDYNSMGRKKKSSSASCVMSPSLSSSIVAIEKEISNDVKQENGLHASKAEEILLPTKNVLGLRSSPKPRHEFMKTYINFSNREALLNDDYSPYTEKCDVKSLNGNPSISKASNVHDNVEKETLNTSDAGEKPATNLAMGFTPTFISKLKKPIEKADSLTLPPKTPKKKGNKKERISSGSTPVAKFKLKRSGSLSSASNKPVNFQNLSSEHFPDISKLMMSEPLNKSGEIDINSDTILIPNAMKEQEIISVTQNPLWSKLKGLSSGTLKRSKKRNRSENSTSS